MGMVLGEQTGTQGHTEVMSPPPNLAVPGRESGVGRAEGHAAEQRGPQPERGSKHFLEESPEDKQEFTKQKVFQAKEQKVQKSAGKRRF